MDLDGAPRVGIVGGGQLARMSAAPAAALGIGLRVLANSPEESAAQVIHDVVIGRHDDLESLRRLAAGCDVVTFDHEHVPPAHLEQLEAMGVAVRPGPSALFHAQDKIHMRQALTDIGVPCPRWRVVSALDHVEEFAEETGWPLVLKTSRGGYDGRGVWVVESPAQAAEVLAVPLAAGAQWLAEERIDFVQELSAQVARSPHGQAVAYPVVRTVQANGICAEVVAPAPGLAVRSRRRGAGDRAADRARPQRDGHARRRAVRRRLRPVCQRARHAAAQLRPLVDRGGTDQPVREPPACGARPSARCPDARGPVRGDGQHPRRRRRQTSTRRTATSSPATRG